MSSFKINFPGTADQFTTNAESAIKQKGGTFTGNENKGNFKLKTAAGTVEGQYEVAGPSAGNQTPVTVTITRKPFIVPMKAIEETVRKFF